MKMTPQEAAEAFSEFERSVGEEAHVSVSLNLNYFGRKGGAFLVSLYPLGLCGKCDSLRAEGSTFEAALSAISDVWEDSIARHRAERTRKMALAIINITAKQGCCTDSALRAGDFTDREVSEYGEAAVEDANNIAQNGPFSITKLSGANAA